MYTAMMAALWGGLSVGAVLLAAAVTNRRLEQAVCEQAEEAAPEQKLMPFRWNKRALFCVLLLAALSAATGAMVAQQTVTPLGMLKLSVGYLGILCAAIVDGRIQVIPNFLPLTLVICRVATAVYEFLFCADALGHCISSLVGCFLCFLVLEIGGMVAKGSIGKGDIKLLSAIGLLCGLNIVIPTLLCALLACVVVAVVLLITKKAAWKTQIPFGPFIYIGYTLVLWFV